MAFFSNSRIPHRRMAVVFFAVALISLLLSTATTVGGPLGAQSGCGEHSFGFEGTRLLNDGISNTAGPFSIDLPAGIYTVTLLGNDNHDTQVDVGTQPGEQFHVILDSGYVSPNSDDIPDDVNDVTTTFTGQAIEHSTAITVEHAGVPGINSVNPICVGFTLEQKADETPIEEAPSEDPPSEPEEGNEPATEEPSTEEVESEEPDPVEVDPPKDVVDPDGADPLTEEQVEVPVVAPIETEVLGAVEEPPIQELIPPVSIVRPEPQVAGPELIDAPQVDVLDVSITQVTPPAQAQALAATGAGDVWKILVMMSAVFLSLGVLCLRWGRLI